jgi:hypothetical protein
VANCYGAIEILREEDKSLERKIKRSLKKVGKIGKLEKPEKTVIKLVQVKIKAKINLKR